MTNIPSQCILITGPGHTGTRLLVEMLNRHPDVSVPMYALNRVQEYEPLHRFFVQLMDNTTLYQEDYWMDERELDFVLGAYERICDMSKPYFVLKVPVYPLYFLETFIRRYQGRIHLIYTRRPIEKVIRSWQKDGSFHFEFDELLRQAKKLAVSERQQALTQLATRQLDAFVRAVDNRCEALLADWHQNPAHQRFIEIDTEELARSQDYLISILEKLGLDTQPINDMVSVIDYNRLLGHPQNTTSPPEYRLKLKRALRALTPPILWSIASKQRR